eukprot:3191381-Alexandrium_andersonii.AAC.1
MALSLFRELCEAFPSVAGIPVHFHADSMLALHIATGVAVAAPHHALQGIVLALAQAVSQVSPMHMTHVKAH